MPRRLAATQENNAWRSRKRVVADYVPECTLHHVNDKAVVRPLASAEGCSAGARLVSGDNSCRKDKRPVVGPAVWQHQNRDALNEAHFDFFELLLLFFFITLLPSLMCPYLPKQWRTINERRMNRLWQSDDCETAKTLPSSTLEKGRPRERP